jgi:hypothetical protein
LHGFLYFENRNYIVYREIMPNNDNIDYKRLFEESELKREQLEFDYQEVLMLNNNLNNEIIRLQGELKKDSCDTIKETEEEILVKLLEILT